MARDILAQVAQGKSVDEIKAVVEDVLKKIRARIKTFSSLKDDAPNNVFYLGIFTDHVGISRKQFVDKLNKRSSKLQDGNNLVIDVLIRFHCQAGEASEKTAKMLNKINPEIQHIMEDEVKKSPLSKFLDISNMKFENTDAVIEWDSDEKNYVKLKKVLRIF